MLGEHSEELVSLFSRYPNRVCLVEPKQRNFRARIKHFPFVTGKTTALNVARHLAEREGFELVGLAPSHSAVRVLEKSGIASQTVQRWLLDRDAESKLTRHSVVVLDEAGLAGTSTLRAVLERVERATGTC